MRAITLWQPWASMIGLGFKTIETRKHNRFRTLAGERIAIHAGRAFDKNWEHLAGEYLAHEDMEKVRAAPHRAGQIICTAVVEGTKWLGPADSHRACIYCSRFDQRYGLFLAKVEAITDETVLKGAQGAWRLPLGWDFAERVTEDS